MTANKPATVAQKPWIGLMSGTSLDGIDGVLVDLEGGTPHCLARTHAVLPEALRAELLALNQPGQNELHRAAVAARDLADAYAGCVAHLLAQAQISAAQVAAIGCHGQTVRHQPQQGYTLQLVDAARLAERTGITTVADFRSRDVAAGGQGAPLVPAFHAAVFGSPASARVIVNIGGFANLTALIPGQAVTGHDCGPGNALLDAWIARHLGHAYDAGGAWAATGVVLPALLDALLDHPFFARQPPRSTGRDEFHLDWLLALLAQPAHAGAAPQDVQRTLLEWTACTIAQDIRALPAPIDAVYVCGGGAFNTALMARLVALLAPATVQGTGALGVEEALVEALAFAWLARQALAGAPGNLPAVTGAAGLRCLGAIYPA